MAAHRASGCPAAAQRPGRACPPHQSVSAAESPPCCHWEMTLVGPEPPWGRCRGDICLVRKQAQSILTEGSKEFWAEAPDEGRSPLGSPTGTLPKAVLSNTAALS